TFSGPGFTPIGNAITLGAGGVRVSSADSAQLGIAITLNSAQAWTVDRDFGVLALSFTGGAVHLNGFALALNVISPQGNMLIGGVIDGCPYRKLRRRP